VSQLAIADAATTATVPIGTAGNGVTWDCSNLVAQVGMPLVTFTVMSPAGTLYASDYPTANWYFTDPVLSAQFGHHYYIMTPDSLVLLGEHAPGNPYEIYDNPELDMAFPMAFNQTVINTYSKTSYNAGGSVSSSQTGDITLTYEGNGTLKLPNATYTDVAKLKSVRTNSIGPTTTSYLWVQAATGERLLNYNGNGTPSAVYKFSAPAGVASFQTDDQVFCSALGTRQVIIRAEHTIESVELYNVAGQRVYSNLHINQHEYSPNVSALSSGVYLMMVKTENGVARKKITL